MPVPFQSVNAAGESLAHLAATDALVHLHAALESLQGLSERLKCDSDRPPIEERRCLERDLLRFRTELRHAAVLADQGLAFCKDWAEYLQPPPSYHADGSYTANPLAALGELSVQV